MKWLFAIFALLATVFFLFGRRAQDASQNALDQRDGITSPLSVKPSNSLEPVQVDRPAIQTAEPKTAPTALVPANDEKLKAIKDEADASTTRDYVVEDGVAVIDGDIVIGLPGQAGRAAQVPKITPWPTREIPVFIQPSVPLPARIAEALTYFDQTAVRFIPYTNQRDVLVFENAEGKCKSYMGKIGGKQPIFIAPNCGPHEIAHELMHALGFIHEQNRTDRDSAVHVNRDNIQPTAIVNFEKFPGEYMTLSGLSPFDYTSVMLYPPSMFSRNGEPTVSSVTGAAIDPSERLSAQDVARINSFYGSR